MLWILIATGVLVLGGLAYVAGSSGAAQAKTRQIYMSAVEWQGSTNISKEAFPTTPLPAGGGYERFEPDAEGNWNVETYRFDTGVVAACQGEKVVLNIFGVNSKEHKLTIPDFGKNFTVYRGQMARTSFVVKKVGIFPIVCISHQPSHRADLVVLPC